MYKLLVHIGDKTYTCQLAKSEEQRRKGLMDISYLAPDEGMLFEFDKEGTQEFWMKNTRIRILKNSVQSS